MRRTKNTSKYNVTNVIQEAQKKDIMLYKQEPIHPPHKRFDFDKKIETNVISVSVRGFYTFFALFSIRN